MVLLGRHLCIRPLLTLIDCGGTQPPSHRHSSTLWSHLPVELDRQAQVGDAAGAVPLHQDVLALQVAVGDGGLALRAVDLRVQVAEARDGGVGQLEQRAHVQRVGAEVVVQRAVLVVVSDQVELRP